MFGQTLTNSAGRVISVRWVGEQHVKEDCGGRIPSMCDWLGRIKPESWMATGHIDHEPAKVGSDPLHEWTNAVATRQTVMGFEEWMQKASIENRDMSDR